VSWYRIDVKQRGPFVPAAAGERIKQGGVGETGRVAMRPLKGREKRIFQANDCIRGKGGPTTHFVAANTSKPKKKMGVTP